MQLMEVVEKQRQYYKSVRDFQEVCHILTLSLGFSFTMLFYIFMYLFVCLVFSQKVLLLLLQLLALITFILLWRENLFSCCCGQSFSVCPFLQEFRENLLFRMEKEFY